MAATPRTRSRGDHLVRALLVVDLVLAGFVGTMFVTVHTLVPGTAAGRSSIEGAVAGFVARPAAPAADVGAGDLDVLLLGTRSTPRAPTSIVVLHVAADRESAAVVRVPPRLRVPIPGFGEGRLENAFGFTSPTLGVRTIEELSDLPIDHYAVVARPGGRGVPGMLDAALRRPRLDAGWSVSAVRDLLADLRAVPSDALHRVGVPVSGRDRERGGPVLYPDRARNRALWRAVRRERVPEWLAAQPRSGVIGRAS